MTREFQKKIYSSTYPSPVAYYWEITCNSIETHCVFPTPYIQLVFPIGNEITIEQITGPVSSPLLCPILKSKRDIVLNATSNVFGIHLHPSFLANILAVPAHELIGNANILNEVLSKRCYETLISIIHRTVSFEERVNKLEAFFHRNYGDYCGNIIWQSVCIIKKDPYLKFRDLCKATGYSERWLQRCFRENLACTPQEIIAIFRFNHLLNNMYLYPDEILTRLALDSGYYDQAHSIRNFRKFAAITPGEFMQKLPEFNAVMNRL